MTETTHDTATLAAYHGQVKALAADARKARAAMGGNRDVITNTIFALEQGLDYFLGVEGRLAGAQLHVFRLLHRSGEPFARNLFQLEEALERAEATVAASVINIVMGENSGKAVVEGLSDYRKGKSDALRSKDFEEFGVSRKAAAPYMGLMRVAERLRGKGFDIAATFLRSAESLPEPAQLESLAALGAEIQSLRARHAEIVPVLEAFLAEQGWQRAEILPIKAAEPAR